MISSISFHLFGKVSEVENLLYIVGTIIKKEEAFMMMMQIIDNKNILSVMFVP